MRGSNYPPGVSGNEPQITGEWPDESEPGVVGNDDDRYVVESPNLMERLENLVACLDEAELEVEKLDIGGDSRASLNRIEDARGIVGEMLTMIDGR